ncbi:MLO-like protein 6 [Vitis vinifera]|uniref:MLO-like protein n=1 Tax=Vitis vinifera TaxID=29760 RepID=A0A438HIQ0_VITVI|nr:MLO-like protein 6 [Vitis vinifera]
MAEELKDRSLTETPTWAVAVVCFVLLAVSIFIEHIIHHIGSWLARRNKRALYEALEKIKAELMLLGFMSLLLTVLQTPISKICISKSVGSTWYPCDVDEKEFKNTCGTESGKVPFVSYYGIHQLHIFIFVLALFHVIYCVATLALGTYKMRRWKTWEDETRTAEYQYSHDPERFRYARETSFGRRHLNFWSSSPVLLWIVCFFRQFYGSVHRDDYLALRHGFIVAHLAPESERKFDFRKYIHRSLEEDFKAVVGISPVIWFCAILFLLTNTHGWYSYFWLPFIPLIILLLVGTKLQVIITELGLRIAERGVVVKGTPIVEPGDHLFWFNRPSLMLFLINFVLFLNAFQLAFFAWSTYGLKSCYHDTTEDYVIRITMGVMTQVLCSYVTLPLYALVTQMGTTMRSTVFNDKVAVALRDWHETARKHTRHGHSDGVSPQSSRPSTPSYGMSPVHLLQSYDNNTPDMSPVASNYDNERWYGEGSGSLGKKDDDEQRPENFESREPGRGTQDSSSAQLALGPLPIQTQHEVNITSSEFSFRRSPRSPRP